MRRWQPGCDAATGDAFSGLGTALTRRLWWVQWLYLCTYLGAGERSTGDETSTPVRHFAAVGQLILLASAWLLPAVSEYHLVGDNISELAIGQYGFVQTLAFVISGLGVLALAYAIHRLTAGIRGSLLGSVFIAIYGLGALVVAIFQPTESTLRRMSGLNPPRVGFTASRRSSRISASSPAC
jgi:hypothetical protein